jgi:heme/copper-type cytochrome/quinol oxidase subunit 2
MFGVQFTFLPDVYIVQHKTGIIHATKVRQAWTLLDDLEEVGLAKESRMMMMMMMIMVVFVFVFVFVSVSLDVID